LLKKKGENEMKKMFAAVLIVAFALSLLLPANAWFHPGTTPTDDGLHNQFGPMTANLLCTVYGGVEQEYTAYKACEVDFMDWSLTAPQVAELETIDPNMNTYARAFFVDRGMREFDFNCKMFPTDDVAFRQALAYCFDKDAFIATQLAGLALKMDSPLSWSSGWYNTYCDNLYPYDLQDAVDLLIANGYTDKDADGWVEGPASEEIALEFYARQDDPDRSAMGQILATTIGTQLSAQDWGTEDPANIKVNLHVAPKSECYQHAMIDFDCHVYTGGWSFGRDPDTLYFLYYSAYAQAFAYTPNYNGYQNPEFDTAAVAMITAPDVDSAKDAVMDMQVILMDDVGVLPVFTYASYGSYKVDWEKVVNAEGTGPWSWFTMLNTHKEGTDTIRWAFMNDVEALNPMHSEWVWDWQVLDKIYDTLINVDPYDMSRDKPWMAESWTLGEWTYQGDPATYIEFKLREDMYWHDIAPKADRQTPSGRPLLQGGAYDVPVTAEDVAFTITCVRDIGDSWNNALVADVVYTEVLDLYTIRVYYGLYMPVWALHWVGGLPIIPRHVWEPVFNEKHTREFDPYAQKCMSGCGPWIMKYEGEGSKIHEYYKLVANTRFFRYAPVDVFGRIDSLKHVEPDSDVTVSFYLHNQDFQRDPIPADTFTVEITITYPNGTVQVIWSGPNPALPPCTEVEILVDYAIHVERGKYEIKATISVDPDSGHGDQDGYSIYIWGSLMVDINLDFVVDGSDLIVAARAFGSYPGHVDWDPRADMNGDFVVDGSDLILIARKFGWPGI